MKKATIAYPTIINAKLLLGKFKGNALSSSKHQETTV